ncbi:GMC family oxidoreductase [Salinisphaera aquimarina]|uniref:GMC family oxidoreductase n=1 Tax=Salinisphaera aquimarina TaxID=2094031 RepID=A0ABV7ESB7_9GAMM
MSSSQCFDFVIVGAGSAGCVLARRLAETGRYSVLLMEAGGRDSYPWIHVPIGYGKTMFNRKVNWGYSTEADPNINDRTVYWPRGKVLGGSSSINGLIYVRGQAEDYDDWHARGCDGWSYEDVLPYFLRAEDQARGDDRYHGVEGPLAVSDVGEPNRLCDAFIGSGEAIGIPRNNDFNGATQEGVGYFQLTVKNGRRCSTASGYLKPVASRKNLEIMTHTLCSRVEFRDRRAVGVHYTRAGRNGFVGARHEVILAGGAINTPQILELSGIGPEQVLAEQNIEPVSISEEVGQNLSDHLQARLIYKCSEPITTNDDLNSFVRKMGIGLRYVLSRKGPLAVGINQAGGFARSGADVERPDIQFHFGTLSSDRPGSPVHRFSGFTLSTCQLRPESRGSVHIRSTDPSVYPQIRANYLATEMDRRIMVDGVKLGRRLAAAAPLSGYITEEYAPGMDVQSDEALLDFVRDDATTIFHPTGTCRMGPDAEAVVDMRLRVRGVDALRVIDASIMPSIVSGNTNAPVIMIAEKGADMILEDVDKQQFCRDIA